MERTYTWQADAENAIREHFRNRNAARAIKSRPYLKRIFQEIRSDGDMIYTFTYRDETVTMIRHAYNVVVQF